MRFIALRMLTADRSKYLGLVFAIAFCTFLLQNQTSIFAGILRRTGSQIADVSDASVWVMDPKTEYFEQTKALKDTDLLRVRGVDGVAWAVRLFKGNPVAKKLGEQVREVVGIGTIAVSQAIVPTFGNELPIKYGAIDFYVRAPHEHIHSTSSTDRIGELTRPITNVTTTSIPATAGTYSWAGTHSPTSTPGGSTGS